MSEMNAWSLAQARDALRAKQVTSVELTEACLSAIEGADALGAFVHKTPELALDLARAADEQLASGEAPDGYSSAGASPSAAGRRTLRAGTTVEIACL